MKAGWNLIVHSLKVFGKYPVLVLPLLIVWAVYAPVVLYTKYVFPWNNYDPSARLAVSFILIFIFSFTILMSCGVMLELIQQIEGGEKISISKALDELLAKDIGRILPLSLVWAIMWFLLSILQALLSKSRKGNDDGGYSAEQAAETLAGYGGFSFSAAFFKALGKGIRMIIFLMLPAICWEDLSFFKSAKKGIFVLRKHPIEFATGYALTYAAAIIVFLPPAIMFKLGTGSHGNPPLFLFTDHIWYGVIIYIGLAWSFCMYIEQMFSATLFLWHLKWENAVEAARSQGHPLPQFQDIPQPSLLDDINDLAKSGFQEGTIIR